MAQTKGTQAIRHKLTDAQLAEAKTQVMQRPESVLY